MVKVVASQQVNAPVETVFDFVADQRQMTTWCLALTQCDLTSEGPVGTGATRIVARKALGMYFDWDWVCDVYDRPQKIVWRTVSGRVPMIDTYEVAPGENGTQVTHTVDTKVPGLLRMLQPLVVRRGKKDMRSDLNELKRILEGSGAGSRGE